uniref:Uncharacterized protein n=1 Tax=Avena sativa TaxID=4498 RepID=A0ACD6AJ13_AVESA
MPLIQICRWHHDIVVHLLFDGDDDWLDGARSSDSAVTSGVCSWRSRLRLLGDDRAICCTSNWLHLRVVSTGNCSTLCGNVSVPYPFGIGPPSCYLPGFNLTCDTSQHPPRLLLGADGTLRVVDISLRNNTVGIIRTGPLYGMDGQDGLVDSFNSFFMDQHDEIPYSLSTRNELVLMGCSVRAVVYSGHGNRVVVLSGCSTFCSSGNYNDDTYDVNGDDDGYCYGDGCCKARISMSNDGMPTEFFVRWIDYASSADKTLPPAYGLIAMEGWFDEHRVAKKVRREFKRRRSSSSTTIISAVLLEQLEVPMVLDWEILQPSSLRQPPTANNRSSQHLDSARICHGQVVCKSKHSVCIPGIRGYSCQCAYGYDSNPYRVDGCSKINPKNAKGISALIGVASGAVIVLVVFLTFLVSKKIKHRRAQMLKRRFFEQNRGQLLQQLVSQRADISERMIITLEELEKATNNFDQARELGGGGHGIVYKGILSDLHVVAIKKPKKVVQKEIDEFINEVAILSQVNHRNVVKLYGCCLETQVPMLVYEFISNGTLHDHLHVEGPISVPWNDRLRIAAETAKSIAYLHSMASIPIIHRDIKSVNILLDDTLTAKVADFGASRYVPVDKSGVTTMVQGTIGYMDPMYFYTGRLTEKSDVYGFGVMLVELLTRRKPFLYMSSEGDGLVVHFATLYGDDDLS